MQNINAKHKRWIQYETQIQNIIAKTHNRHWQSFTHSQTLTGTHKHSQSLTSTHKHSQSFANTHIYSQTRTETHIYSQDRTRTGCFFRMWTRSTLVNDFSRPNRLLEKPPDQSTESHLIGCCVNSWVLASNWSKEISSTVSWVWFSRNSISMTLNTDISISLQFFTKRPSDLKS